MNEEAFEKYLKKAGRKENVRNKYIGIVRGFEQFLNENQSITQIQKTTPDAIEDYAVFYEKKSKKSARTVLYALMQYYKSLSNVQMATKAEELRAPRKTKKPIYPLKEFLGIDPDYISKLSSAGISNVKQMREAGKTKILRNKLSKKTSIPYSKILELVQLSDLERLGYVKKKLTRLYYNAGIKIPKDLVSWTPDELHEHFKKYISDSGWEGIIPFKSDLADSISSAKSLPDLIEYD
ncbi:MAG: DUF4332 domain-containing protein [Candidatus Hodarchaeales archaeon]|jgi:hypothetical protein